MQTPEGPSVAASTGSFVAGTATVPLSQGKDLLEQHRTGSLPTELESSETPTPMLNDAQSQPPYSPAKSMLGEGVGGTPEAGIGGKPVVRSLEKAMDHERVKEKVRGLLEGFSIAKNLLDLELTPEELEQVLDQDFTSEEKKNAVMFMKTFYRGEHTLSKMKEQLDAMKSSGGDPSEIAALEKKVAYLTGSEKNDLEPPPNEVKGSEPLPKDVPGKVTPVEPKIPEVAGPSEGTKNVYWQFLVLNTCCSRMMVANYSSITFSWINACSKALSLCTTQEEWDIQMHRRCS